MCKREVLALAQSLGCEVEAHKIPPGMGDYTEVTIEPTGDWELEPGLTGWVCHGWEDALSRLQWLTLTKGGDRD